MSSQTVLRSAFDYREYNLGVYGVELPMIDPWTSGPSIIEIVLHLFESTTRFVESPTSRSDPNTNKTETSDQLPELASVLFACCQERLEWLGRYALNCLYEMVLLIHNVQCHRCQRDRHGTRQNPIRNQICTIAS